MKQKERRFVFCVRSKEQFDAAAITPNQSSGINAMPRVICRTKASGDGRRCDCFIKTKEIASGQKLTKMDSIGQFVGVRQRGS